jgi:hypothetical protein
VLGTISSASGVLEQVLVRDLRVEPDAEFAGAVTYWRGRYGFRAQVGFSESSLLLGGPPFDAASRTNGVNAIDIDTWSYDMRGAIGLVEYDPGKWVWPYAFFGFGGITYDLARTVDPPLLTFIEHAPPRAAERLIAVDIGRDFLLALDELGTETVFAFNFGVGTDLRIPLGPSGIGVRLELSDQITASPVTLRLNDLSCGGALACDTGFQFRAVHHLRVAAGLVLSIGR